MNRRGEVWKMKRTPLQPDAVICRSASMTFKRKWKQQNPRWPIWNGRQQTRETSWKPEYLRMPNPDKVEGCSTNRLRISRSNCTRFKPISAESDSQETMYRCLQTTNTLNSSKSLIPSMNQKL